MRGVAVGPKLAQVVRRLRAECRVIFASRDHWKETRRQEALTRILPPHPMPRTLSRGRCDVHHVITSAHSRYIIRVSSGSFSFNSQTGCNTAAQRVADRVRLHWADTGRLSIHLQLNYVQGPRNLELPWALSLHRCWHWKTLQVGDWIDLFPLVQ